MGVARPSKSPKAVVGPTQKCSDEGEAGLAKLMKPTEVKKGFAWSKVTAVRGDSNRRRPETVARSRSNTLFRARSHSQGRVLE